MLTKTREAAMPLWPADPKTIQGNLDFSGKVPANIRLE
jgi:hypothetical protein